MNEIKPQAVCPYSTLQEPLLNSTTIPESSISVCHWIGIAILVGIAVHHFCCRKSCMGRQPYSAVHPLDTPAVDPTFSDFFVDYPLSSDRAEFIPPSYKISKRKTSKLANKFLLEADDTDEGLAGDPTETVNKGFFIPSEDSAAHVPPKPLDPLMIQCKLFVRYGNYQRAVSLIPSEIDETKAINTFMLKTEKEFNDIAQAKAYAPGGNKKPLIDFNQATIIPYKKENEKLIIDYNQLIDARCISAHICQNQIFIRYKPNQSLNYFTLITLDQKQKSRDLPSLYLQRVDSKHILVIEADRRRKKLEPTTMTLDLRFALPAPKSNEHEHTPQLISSMIEDTKFLTF
jgi:hypothetical protein